MSIRISPHFKRAEFECPCGCGFDTVDAVLIYHLEDMANYFQDRYNAERVLIYILSGNRCRNYNEVIQKKYNPNYVPFSSDSQHIYARAADFWVEYRIGRSFRKTIEPLAIYEYLKKTHLQDCGIGLYSNRVHYDTKTGPQRLWDKR